MGPNWMGCKGGLQTGGKIELGEEGMETGIEPSETPVTPLPEGAPPEAVPSLPTVVSTDPANDDAGVSKNAAISATFSVSMDPATINSSSFILKDNADHEVAGSVSVADKIATFTPSSALSVIMTYKATIKSGVKDVQGNAMAEDYSWSFTTDRSWSAPRPVDTTGPSGSPCAAIDQDGNAVAAWNQLTVNYHIFSNRYDASTQSWGTPLQLENLSPPDSTPAFNCRIAMDSGGNAYVIWYQLEKSSGFKNIFANRYDAIRGVWDITGAGIAIGLSPNPGAAIYPEIAVNRDGKAFAVWRQTEASGRNSIYAAKYNPATASWEAPVPIEYDDTLDAGPSAPDLPNPDIVITEMGNALAVWYQSDGTYYNIYANRCEYDVGWGGATTLKLIGPTPNTANQTDPRISIDRSSNAMAVWHAFDGTNFSVYANAYNPGSDMWWSEPRLLDSGSREPPYPQVAAYGDKNAIVVWAHWDSVEGKYYIYAKRYITEDGTSRWEDTQKIAESSKAASAPMVAVDQKGNAIAVWYQFEDVYPNIFAARYINGIGWQKPKRIGLNPNPGYAAYPQIAMNKNGAAVVVWGQVEGGAGRIYSARFE
jgi:hypothetical protein